MKAREFPQRESLVTSAATASQTNRTGGQGIATRDRDTIRRWAARHSAEPATGEATESGPATIGVNDGGAGIRFNFPGVGRFRPISWDEWFANFDRHDLVFVYEEEVADRAYALWQERGGGHGDDRRDWFEAERQQRSESGGSSARYRIVKKSAGLAAEEPPDCA